MRHTLLVLAMLSTAVLAQDAQMYANTLNASSATDLLRVENTNTSYQEKTAIRGKSLAAGGGTGVVGEGGDRGVVGIGYTGVIGMGGYMGVRAEVSAFNFDNTALLAQSTNAYYNYGIYTSALDGGNNTGIWAIAGGPAYSNN